MTTKEIVFKKDVFLNLLRKELNRCSEFTFQEYSITLPNKRILYIPFIDPRYDWINDYHLLIPSQSILPEEKGIEYLLNKDGFFRNWINISPFGTTNNETIYKITFSVKWTNKIIVGDLAYKREPFLVTGPSIIEETELSLNKLPYIELLSEDFDWELEKIEINWKDNNLRLEQTRQLTIRLNSFSISDPIKKTIFEWINKETDDNIISSLLFMISINTPKFKDMLSSIYSFCFHKNLDVRTNAYKCVDDKSLLLECLKKENKTKNRTLLIRLLTNECNSIENELKEVLKNFKLNNIEKRILKNSSIKF